MKILIKNATVLTMDKENSIKSGVSIGISEGVIRFIENGNSKCVDGFKADKVINADKKVIMPGLINMHTHIPMTLLRNYADDLGLQDWLFNHIIPVENKFTKEEVKWGTYLGLVELIKSGVTTFNDMYFEINSMIDPIIEAGIRGNICGLPYQRQGNRFIDDYNVIKENIRALNGDTSELLSGSIFIHSLYANSEKEIRSLLDLAKELKTSIHIHVSEGYDEEMSIREKYGMTSLQLLNSWGVLEVPVIAAHCVHVTNEDIELMNEKGITPVHCPSSNLKLGNGFSPIDKMIDKKVNVCIGTDGPSSNNNLNMLEEMHLASLIHKGNRRNPEIVTAEDILNMATINGAKALGLENSIGAIKVGMDADLIILDVDVPHCTPLNNPMSMVAYSTQGSDVETVIVKGKVIMENKEILTLDEERAKYEVNRLAKKLL